jgi:hypothetical protein
MKTKPQHWSRDYFTKQDDGKFQCNFGCGAKYTENASRFEKHLLVNLVLFCNFYSLFRINARKSGWTRVLKSTAMNLLSSKFMKNPVFAGRESKVNTDEFN